VEETGTKHTTCVAALDCKIWALNGVVLSGAQYIVLVYVLYCGQQHYVPMPWTLGVLELLC